MIELTKDEMAIINTIGKKEGCDRDGDILSFFVKEDEDYARVLSRHEHLADPKLLQKKRDTISLSGRKVSVFCETTGEWLEVFFCQITDKMVFRIFDDGQRYMDKNKNTVWIAKGSAYLNDKGIWEVKTLY